LSRQAPNLSDRILVLERSGYPRDKICAGGLGARADMILTLLGVDCDVPSVPVRGISLCVQSGSQIQRGRGTIGRVVRRFEFDQAIAASARKRGVRIEERVRVTDMMREGLGWRVTTSHGSLWTRVVVGADGVGSAVRRAVCGRGTTLQAQAVEVDTPLCASDPERDLLHFDASDTRIPGYCWDFPTQVDGHAMVCRGAYVLKLGGHGPDVGEVLSRHLARSGLDPDAYSHKRYSERGYSPRETLSLPGVLLVGEAAGVDPITGEGIPQALASGELAGRCIALGIETGDLRFQDWAAQVRGERFGFDLSLRASIVPHFYGPERAWLEHVLVGNPWFLRAGVEYFAGRHVPRSQLALAAWHAGKSWANSRLSR
jgi:flavin-dependent dehydrogenase